MLKEKKGVLATRSPHRPNPIGVTLARVEKIDKKTRSVLLSACDLVHGTPVLDIKPYVPNYDAVEPCRVPAWIVETINTRNQVIISEEARAAVMDRKLQSKLKLYKNQPELFLTGTRCSAAQCNAVQCSTMPCNATQCNATQYNAMQYNAVQCNTMQYSAIHMCTQYSAVIWDISTVGISRHQS
jgi:hypothetical protein